MGALLAAATSPEEAVQALKPSMQQEKIGVHNDGSLLFAWWGSEHRQAIFDSDRATETSFALVQKDADEELGRRMCTKGMIVEIHKRVFEGQKFFWGLLLTRGGTNLVSFWAVGSTGRLVENNWAGFCGFVTGTYDYSNSVGGTGHAVELVGHFLLPENRASPAPRRSTAITTSDVPGTSLGVSSVPAAFRKRPNPPPGVDEASWGRQHASDDDDDGDRPKVEPPRRNRTARPSDEDNGDRPKGSARTEPKEPAYVDPFQ
jgi:hypothetical protein